MFSRAPKAADADLMCLLTARNHPNKARQGVIYIKKRRRRDGRADLSQVESLQNNRAKVPDDKMKRTKKEKKYMQSNQPAWKNGTSLFPRLLSY
jgi:hypothetical protein